MIPERLIFTDLFMTKEREFFQQKNTTQSDLHTKNQQYYSTCGEIHFSFCAPLDNFSICPTCLKDKIQHFCT